MANNTTYFIVKDKHGEDYLCPLDRIRDRHAVTDQEFEECVEKDVVGRYAGDIDLEPF